MRRRGKSSWQFKFEGGSIDPVTKKRRTVYHSFKGTRVEAAAELARLVSEVKSGERVDRSKMTLAEFLDAWELSVATRVTPKTLERYIDLMKSFVRPRLGACRIQDLRNVSFTDFYAKLLREGRGSAEAPKPLSARTVGHVHRVLHSALEEAIAQRLIGHNPTRLAKRPREEQKEPEILTEHQVPELLRKLKDHPLYPIVSFALASGMRRGELLALRWKDLDLDAARAKVEHSIEETRNGLRVKPPKSRAGRRSIRLPASSVLEMRAHWKWQQELRLKLGLGKAPDDALVFAHPDGSIIAPSELTDTWRRLTRSKSLGLPKVTFHALRHTHVSQLIAAGLDVVTISKRIGHSSPALTLRVYAHRFSNTDDRAAQVIEAAMQRVLTE
jgi:integrase